MQYPNQVSLQTEAYSSYVHARNRYDHAISGWYCKLRPHSNNLLCTLTCNCTLGLLSSSSISLLNLPADFENCTCVEHKNMSLLKQLLWTPTVTPKIQFWMSILKTLTIVDKGALRTELRFNLNFPGCSFKENPTTILHGFWGQWVHGSRRILTSKGLCSARICRWKWLWNWCHVVHCLQI